MLPAGDSRGGMLPPDVEGWKIFRGELRDLAAIVKGNKLTLTTMIVVGEAIGNREGLSRLYSGQFTHLFRKGNPD